MIRFLPFVFLLITASACVVPVQMTRVTLTESFEQSFDFAGIDRDDMTPILEKLLGANFKVYSSEEVISKWYSNDFVSEGFAVMTFSIVPGKKPEYFTVNGVGAYDIYYRGDPEKPRDASYDQVYFSTKFYLLDTLYALDDLENDEPLSIFFKQVAVNQFLSPSYALKPQKPIRVEVEIKKSKTKALFSIDYSAYHEVYIDEQKIGTIKFRAPLSPFDKLIDLRGVRSLTRRYKKSWLE